MAEPDEESSRPKAGTWFATTHWTVVWQAKTGDSPESTDALATLYRTYAPALMSYLRRAGCAEAEAEDLTHDFFERLIEKKLLSHLRHQEGRFRSFLLTLLKNFLLEQRGRARAQKRGGGQKPISWQELAAEGSYLAEPADHLSPDQIYDRRWAQSLIHRANCRLKAEYESTGRGELFQYLADFQPRQSGSLSYLEMGGRLNMSESAMKSAALRLRQRHREIVREEVALTASPEELESELKYLHSVLSQGVPE